MPNLSTPVIFSGPEELSALSVHGPHVSQTWARTLFTAGPTRAANLTRAISMRPQVFDFNIKSGIRFHSSQKVWVYPFFPEYNYLVNVDPFWKRTGKSHQCLQLLWYVSGPSSWGHSLPLTQYGTGLKTGSVLETRLRTVTFYWAVGPHPPNYLSWFFFCRLHRTMPLLSAHLSCPRNIMLH